MTISIISTLSFAIIILLLLQYIVNKIDLFSPSKIFTIIWAFTIGITDLKLSWLQHEWSITVWLQIILGPICFLLGCFYYFIKNMDEEVVSIEGIRNSLLLKQINQDKLFTMLNVLFLTFLLGYFLIFLKTGEIPIFSAKPWLARTNFTLFGVGLFLHNVVLLVILSGVYLINKINVKVKKIYVILISFSSVLLYSFTLQRFQIFFSFFVFIVILYYLTKKINIKTLILTLIIAILVFYLISSFRAGEVIINFLYSQSRMKYSSDYAIFTEPYMYFSMNLENYALSIESIEEYTYGFYTFDFITAITGLKHWVIEYFHLKEYPFIKTTYNTYSAFWTYYRDFGIIGISFLPFIGGYYLNTLYYSFRKNPEIDKLLFYGIFLFGTIFTFFISIFGFLWFIYNLVCLYFILSFCKVDKIS